MQTYLRDSWVCCDRFYWHVRIIFTKIYFTEGRELTFVHISMTDALSASPLCRQCVLWIHLKGFCSPQHSLCLSRHSLNFLILSERASIRGDPQRLSPFTAGCLRRLLHYHRKSLRNASSTRIISKSLKNFLPKGERCTNQWRRSGRHSTSVIRGRAFRTLARPRQTWDFLNQNNFIVFQYSPHCDRPPVYIGRATSGESCKNNKRSVENKKKND